MEIVYKPLFLRQYRKLPKNLQEEVKEKIAMFREDPTHHALKTHKLQGPLKGCWSFRVNYSYHIVFAYESKRRAALLVVGDHAIYG